MIIAWQSGQDRGGGKNAAGNPPAGVVLFYSIYEINYSQHYIRPAIKYFTRTRLGTFRNRTILQPPLTQNTTLTPPSCHCSTAPRFQSYPCNCLAPLNNLGLRTIPKFHLPLRQAEEDASLRAPVQPPAPAKHNRSNCGTCLQLLALRWPVQSLPTATVQMDVAP